MNKTQVKSKVGEKEDKCMRYLTKREIRNELFGLLAMCNGFSELGHVGGKRQEEMIKHLPHQIACRIMELQDLIDTSQIGE